MSLRQRDDAVQKFKNDKDITIMLSKPHLAAVIFQESNSYEKNY